LLNLVIGVYWVQGVWQADIGLIVNAPLRNAWMFADEVLGMLKPRRAAALQTL
jgi:hypothetical protein